MSIRVFIGVEGYIVDKVFKIEALPNVPCHSKFLESIFIPKTNMDTTDAYDWVDEEKARHEDCSFNMFP